MGNPIIDKRKEVNEHIKNLVERLITLTNQYLPRIADTNEYAVPADRRAVMRDELSVIFAELHQQITTMDLPTLRLLQAQTATLLMDRGIKSCKHYEDWSDFCDDVQLLIEQRSQNIDAFFLFDTKAKVAKNAMNTIPTIEGVLDRMMYLCDGNKLEMYKALQYGRFLLIAGKRVPLSYEVKNIDLEIKFDF
jgi:hypothetical protein